MRKSRTPAMPEIKPSQLLGGLRPEIFLRDYWQKRPLLVRQALPEFALQPGRHLDPNGLLKLATRDEAESRLVRQSRGRWTLDQGPFVAGQLDRLPKKNWSLLVSGVNLLLPFGDHLLQAFGFMPQARLDDLMVSYAPLGGGVGPHFDSYDVFLLQGYGQRRWEVSAQTDLALVEDAPLRILKHFQPEQAWTLEPGDMLYLPPKYAHNGIALSPCMTWSIGFRAPTCQEIATAFLGYMQDRLDLKGIYEDPELRLPKNPAELTPEMVQRLSAMIHMASWTQQDEADFLGTYLSEPKPHIFFDPPARPVSLSRFAKQAAERGVRLDPRSKLLFIKGGGFYLNGELFGAPKGCRPAMTRLANDRRLSAGELPEALLPLLHEWYQAGYVWPDRGT